MRALHTLLQPGHASAHVAWASAPLHLEPARDHYVSTASVWRAGVHGPLGSRRHHRRHHAALGGTRGAAYTRAGHWEGRAFWRLGKV